MESQTKPTQKQQLRMMRLWWGKQLDVRAFLVFRRTQRFYSTFAILAALVSGLSVAALAFPEYHSNDGHNQVSEGFFCSSAITSVISAVMGTMLLFSFEGVERACRVDLAVVWMPLILLDLSIVEFLVGMVCWYWDNNARWRGALMAAQLAVLLGFTIILSIWIWFQMSKSGGLGREEIEAAAANRRGADE